MCCHHMLIECVYQALRDDGIDCHIEGKTITIKIYAWRRIYLVEDCAQLLMVFKSNGRAIDSCRIEPANPAFFTLITQSIENWTVDTEEIFSSST